MYNILVTGSSGQLGCELKALSQSTSNFSFFFTDSSSLNITDFDAVKMFIKNNNIQIIINCAAYTAVDLAETNVEVCELVNHFAVSNLANLSKQYSIKLIHISTDYIFDGINFKPYTELDITNPQSIYGKSKLAGEKAMILANLKNSIIIRTSWVYSSYGNNFLKTMLRLGNERDKLSVVSDQIGSPTFAHDLAAAILEVIPKLNNQRVEVFNFSNEGVCSWYDFAKSIFEYNNVSIKVTPIESKMYPTPAKRPFYSVLDKNKIKKTYNIEIPYWKDSLKEALLILNRRT